jgi:phosphate:Na+ symporter
MATLLQSATATIGVVIGLGAAGIVNDAVAVPVVIGANVGLALTTLAVGWRQVESRRLGAANLMLKLIVAALAFIAMPRLALWLASISPDLPLANRVANLHTAFNVAQAMIGLPLIGVMDALMKRAIRTSATAQRSFGPKFISHSARGVQSESPALAVGQSLREILHMSEIVRSMLTDVWVALKRSDEQLAHQIRERDDRVDLLDREIKRFLTNVVRDEIDPRTADEEIRQLQYLTDLETVGDIVDKNLAELVLKKIRLRADFTAEGERELDDFHRRVVENMVVADTVFASRDEGLADQLLRHKEELNLLEQTLRDQHFARLNAGLVQAHETSAIHLDLLTHLKRINSSLAHAAYAVSDNHRRNNTMPDTDPPAPA